MRESEGQHYRGNGHKGVNKPHDDSIDPSAEIPCPAIPLPDQPCGCAYGNDADLQGILVPKMIRLNSSLPRRQFPPNVPGRLIEMSLQVLFVGIIGAIIEENMANTMRTT